MRALWRRRSRQGHSPKSRFLAPSLCKNGEGTDLVEGFGQDFRKGFGHLAIPKGRREAVQRLQKAAKKRAEAAAVTAAPCRRLRAGAVLQRTVGRRGALASGWRRGRLGRLGGGGLSLGLGLTLHVAGLVAALGLVVCERTKEAVVRNCLKDRALIMRATTLRSGRRVDRCRQSPSTTPAYFQFVHPAMSEVAAYGDLRTKLVSPHTSFRSGAGEIHLCIRMRFRCSRQDDRYERLAAMPASAV